MEAVRKTVSADMLLPVMDLPWATKGMQVEVIVIPQVIEKSYREEVSLESLEGCLRSYANPALWKKEQYAWEDNIIDKYGNN
jgi:uncharacterized protein YktA (UPF0223 family)